MDVDELRKRVEEGVLAALLPQLMERYKRSHMKRSWRGCECSYCETKRNHHQYLQFAPYYLSHEDKQKWRDGRVKYCRDALDYEAEKVI
jgi:hypothetical protein